MASLNWEKALSSIQVAQNLNIDYSWYRNLLKTTTLREKYDHGYWLAFYVYQDLKAYCMIYKDEKLLLEVKKAYYGGNWENLVLLTSKKENRRSNR
jgi:heme oxygenase